MSLYTLHDEDTAELIASVPDDERGWLWRDDRSDMPASERLRERLHGPPWPGRWNYYVGPDGEHYCWATTPLPEAWYAPVRWIAWVETHTPAEDGSGTWVDRDPDRITFTDLRREAKEQAWAWYVAACTDAGVDP